MQIQLTLPRPHTAQLAMLREARRYNVAACGRRFGKSTLAIELLSRPALEAQPVAYFSPTYKLLIEVWRLLETTLQPVIQRSNATERRIELITGGVIECWSMDNPDAGRSRRYARAVIDEAGLVADLGERWQAAIRPTLADLRGDAWLMGTPKGRNFFWECYNRGKDDTQPDWMAWQKPTSANPHIHPDEITAMRGELTERRFNQEILAQFLDDAGGVFRGVLECATLQSPIEPTEGHRYIIGCDWGKSSDYTVFAVLDTTARQCVALDRSNQVDYTVQRGRLQGLCERWNPDAVIAESNSMGEPIIEALLRSGLPVRPFVTTNASKAVIIDALALAFERRDIAIINHPVLVAELQAYEESKSPTGLTRYSAPEGMHDDTVMALALAWGVMGRTNSAVGAFAR
jgi:terminase large subunit-like protein